MNNHKPFYCTPADEFEWRKILEEAYSIGYEDPRPDLYPYSQNKRIWWINNSVFPMLDGLNETAEYVSVDKFLNKIQWRYFGRQLELLRADMDHIIGSAVDEEA